MEYLDLPMKNGRKLGINYNRFSNIREELEKFLEDENQMNNIDFVKRILFNLEIKSNNTVEGINDDLFFIEKAIKNADNINDCEKRRRIINMYNGYKYIINNKDMNEDSLVELYSILSNGLLEERDLTRMGNRYRTAPVYILNRGRLDKEYDTGVNVEDIDYLVNKYFEYVILEGNGTITDEFIKSQVLHFYFVYIHPYFDVNGRTSRTMSMWYLLNKEAFPYIIFNRAINFADSNYDEAISDVKKSCDISFFINYMMENVKKELAKEKIMEQIKENTSEKMTSIDFQTLNYILSMNGEINVLTFSTMYRDKNGYISVKKIYEKIIKPLLEKDVLYVERLTSKNMFGNYKNEVLKIRRTKFDINDPKIKSLNLSNK